MYTMKESVAVAKEADAKKGVSPTNNSIHRLRDEPERQLGSLRDVIGNIRHDGNTPSVDSIAANLSSMHTAQRAPVLLALQQTHGNRYVQRVVAGIQAKLVVGQLGDIYEQEADRVADAVMRMPEPRVQRQVEPEDEETLQTKPLAEQITPFVQVQRQEEPEEEEETLQAKPLAEQITPLVQRQVEPEEEEELLQAKTTGGVTPEVTPAISSGIQSLQGGGRPLSGPERSFFEPRFGADFSNVRVHNDTQAANVARSVNARAFTLGHNVVFGTGEYSSDTLAGRKLLAHELTHVVQQASDLNQGTIVSKMEIASANNSYILLRYVSPAVGSAEEPSVIPNVGSLESCRAGSVSLYGPEREPRQEHVDQGTIGDCYLLAALAALTRTQRGRSHITSHIRPNRDGTFTVTLYSQGDRAEHIRMHPRFLQGGASTTPTLAQGSGSAQHCIIWVALYERAVGHLRARGSTTRSYYFGGMALNSTFLMIAGSGFASWGARGTGHNEIFIDASRDDKIETWRTIWESLQETNKFIAIDTTSGTNSCDSRLQGPHAYAITQAYTRDGTYYIDLYNPHGAYVNRVDFIRCNFARVQILSLDLPPRSEPAEPLPPGATPFTCFPGDVPITLGDGSEILISTLRPGQYVLAADMTNTIRKCKVTDVHIHSPGQVLILQFTDGRILKVTANHLVYSSGQWVEASELSPGDSVSSLTFDHCGITSLILENVINRPFETETLYDITVDNCHTFFAQGILVHNKI